MYNVSFYSNPLLTNCTFSGNAAVLGGGMCNRDGCSPMLSDCTFSGNKAREGGGMLNSYRSNPILANCTLSGNWADFGGGIYNHGSTSDVTNCIIWNNSAETDGDQIALALFYGMSSDYVSTLMVSYSDLEGGLPAVYFDPNCSVIWGIGNIDVDPCFVEPGYWDDNKTPEDANDDFWIDGDYHLQSEGWRWDSMRERWDFDSMTSRCIDAGNPGSPIGEEMLSVPNDPNNEYGVNLRINMGAYGGTTEASMSPHDWALLADLTNDGKVTLDDVGAQTEDWLYKSNDLPGDLDRNGIVDMYDFALFAQDWSEQTLWFQP